MSRARGWCSVVLTAALLLLAGAPSLAAPARDSREMQAREAFAASRFQDALDLFVKLYAETLHPNYLRNIGRSYQNLGVPDKAISSFREYLRKAKKLSPEERTEIERYIVEMEELQRKNAAAAVAAGPVPGSGAASEPAPARPGQSLGSPALASARGASVLPASAAARSELAPPAALGLTAPAPAATPSRPLYKRWWFWAAVGGAVAAGTVGLYAGGVIGGAKDPTCMERVCM